MSLTIAIIGLAIVLSLIGIQVRLGTIATELQNIRDEIERQGA